MHASKHAGELQQKTEQPSSSAQSAAAKTGHRRVVFYKRRPCRCRSCRLLHSPSPHMARPVLRAALKRSDQSVLGTARPHNRVAVMSPHMACSVLGAAHSDFGRHKCHPSAAPLWGLGAARQPHTHHSTSGMSIAMPITRTACSQQPAKLPGCQGAGGAGPCVGRDLAAGCVVSLLHDSLPAPVSPPSAPLRLDRRSLCAPAWPCLGAGAAPSCAVCICTHSCCLYNECCSEHGCRLACCARCMPCA